jgi:dTDP-4-dehydrorhamnose reductase
LAQIAKTQQAKSIHISTDYVFDGESDNSYTEADA